MRTSGISDPFVTQNRIEALCNRFAGSFLVSESYVSEILGNVTLGSDPDLNDVARAGRRLKISQQAAVLRLEQLGLFKTGSHEKWKSIIRDLGNPDFSEKGGGAGEPPPQEKVKLAKYGFRFARAFDQLLREGRISEINLYRLSGLKPKYQRAYFDFAKAITESELQSLELDDGG
jgi:Zn-dependent peptidase ImmA (M78 family)